MLFFIIFGGVLQISLIIFLWIMWRGLRYILFVFGLPQILICDMRCGYARA